VCAWDFPAAYGWALNYSDANFAAEARKALCATIRQVLGDVPDVPPAARVEQGHPAQVLADASRGAGLLVVGGRGHGAFTGMLLGSVSRHCT
jgi:nucleotide-binding universal stress UspA family protein